MKDNIADEYKSQVDDDGRCFKIVDKPTQTPTYFCVYFGKHDLSMTRQLTVVEGRWLALFYADFYCTKANQFQARESVNQFSKMTGGVEVDSSILQPISVTMRQWYLQQRHETLVTYNSGGMSEYSATLKLNKLKNGLVDRACNGVEVCKKALYYEIDKGILPLSGIREKFAMDTQNPFNTKIPNTKILITPVPMGKGRELVAGASHSHGGAAYWASTLAATSSGELPNMTNIKLAFNTFVLMRSNPKKKIQNIGQLMEGCKQSAKCGMNEAKRKVSLMAVTAKTDPFLKYLGVIFDKTNGEK
jgi:hypothetical protein